MSTDSSDTVYRTDLPGVPLVSRGKVRDVYELGDHLLMVSTDRLSAFDCVFPDPIPDKGRVLNQLSAFWFRQTAERVPNHLITIDPSEFPEAAMAHREVLRGRAALVRKVRIFPVECVARGFLAGSGWKEYRETGTVCGIRLPQGLREAEALPQPIFTPATKADTGHDLNISFDAMVGMLGGETAEKLRALTLDLYRFGADFSRTRGILVADTKFEFGLLGGTILLADEILTPDSSRFWPADRYAPGNSPPSFDKQFVRDWLESIGWDKQPPVPRIPEHVVEGVRERYLEIFRVLTGHVLDDRSTKAQTTKS
jgi:phosphoribosylaminoimidazole-succinocarboxamide synthase